MSTELGTSDVVGVIEAGGTWIRCAIGRSADDVAVRGAAETFRTEEPEATMSRVCTWLAQAARSSGGELRAIAVASFGPLERDAGRIAATPKARWSGVSWRDTLNDVFPRVPVALDTDVNAAALGECRHGALRGTSVGVYLTVGTGIGGGVVVDNSLLHGLAHPEIGHVLFGRAPEDDFAGSCPFHGGCLEGLASGQAIRGRWGVAASELPPDHRGWTLEAHYLGRAVGNLLLTFSAQRVVLGGGVLKHPSLLSSVRSSAADQLAGYLDWARQDRSWEDLIAPPGLGEASALVGAYELAMDLLGRSG